MDETQCQEIAEEQNKRLRNIERLISFLLLSIMGTQKYIDIVKPELEEPLI